MKRVFIVFGYNASPGEHWFPWLASSLTSLGASVSVLPLPDAARPDLAAWTGCIADAVGDVDEETYFIGHSLGCIIILRYLEQLPPDSRVGGYLLVSPFIEALPHLAEATPFVDAPLNETRLTESALRRTVIASLNDWAVPWEMSMRVCQSLDAKWRPVENGGHFLDREGFTELPAALEEARAMLSDRADA